MSPSSLTEPQSRSCVKCYDIYSIPSHYKGGGRWPPPLPFPIAAKTDAPMLGWSARADDSRRRPPMAPMAARKLAIITASVHSLVVSAHSILRPALRADLELLLRVVTRPRLPDARRWPLAFAAHPPAPVFCV